jgi:AcrR family transcriptional regulator
LIAQNSKLEFWFVKGLTHIPATPPPGLAHPAQDRSRRTLERLLDSATRLLDEQSFEELTIAEVVQVAGSSVGAFYGRFRDKAALLDTLDELYTQEMMALVEGFFDEIDRDPPASLADMVRRLIRGLVRFHRQRRGMVRALVLRARVHREPGYEERTRRMNRLTPGIVRRLLRHRDEIAHPDPDRAAALGFSMAYTAMRERILFPETFRLPSPPSDAELVTEVTRLLVGYLGTTTRGAA